MLTVDVVDPKAAGYKKTVTRVARWLMQTHKKGDFSLEIALVGNKTLAKNVLAFPPVPGFITPGKKRKYLGEIYLNPWVIKKQGWGFEFMLIHGFLHLLGYDHMNKRDRISMERVENRLLKAIDARRFI